MAYIRVDHSQFEKTATAIDNYVSLAKKKMNEAQTNVEQLTMNWIGDDSIQFKQEWYELTNYNSTYNSMIKSLESYANYLRHASKKYKEAQANAVNRANGLPRF